MDDEIIEPIDIVVAVPRPRIYFTWASMVLSVLLTAAGACAEFGVGYGLMVGGALCGVWAFIIGSDS